MEIYWSVKANIARMGKINFREYLCAPNTTNIWLLFKENKKIPVRRNKEIVVNDVCNVLCRVYTSTLIVIYFYIKEVKI